MKMFWAVFRREVRSFFLLPQTFGIAAAYFIISGVFFLSILVSTQAPDLEKYYSNIANTLLVMAPIVAMRSFAEERRSGALDLSLSWPISRGAILAGKFTANTLLMWSLASISWVYVRLLSRMSDVEVGKAASGYVGLLLLAAAFSAVALAVSARASSPTAAAFLGFGILLTFWILDFAPGFIGSRLRSLSPQRHLESFRQGAIYLEEVVYFVTVVAIGVGLALHALARSGAGRKAATLLRREVGIVAVAAIGVLGSVLADQSTAQFDLTSTKKFTPTPATKAVVRRVEKPVTLIGFVDPFGSDASRLRALVKEYRTAGLDMKLRIVDPDVELAATKQFHVVSYGQFVVELGKRTEILDSINQISVTSAIMRLSRAAPPTVCFSVGHGERDLESATKDGISSLRGHLDRIGYRAEAVALGASGGADKLKQCDVVAVVGPQVPLAQPEFDLLQQYAREDGRLVLFSNGGAVKDQLNEFLRPWGVQLGAGTVVDRSSLAGDPGSVVSFDYPSGSSVTQDVRVNRIPTLWVNPTEIALAPGGDSSQEGWFSPLVQTTAKSWMEKTDGTREDGPFVLGAVADRSRVKGADLRGSKIARTRIAVLGSADVASNRSIDLFGNATLVTGVIQYAAFQDDIIAAGRDPGGLYKLVLTSSQRSDVVRRGIVFPTLAALLPVPLVLWRLRRG